MRAASSSVEASAPTTSLPLKRVKPIKRDEPSDADASSHRRKIPVVKSEPKPPVQSKAEPIQAPAPAPPERVQPTPQMRAPTPEEVEADPLVKSVLDVFQGEIKRVHPKNR